MEQQQCATKVLRAAEEELQKYLTMSKRVPEDIPEFLKMIDLAQGRRHPHLLPHCHSPWVDTGHPGAD